VDTKLFLAIMLALAAGIPLAKFVEALAVGLFEIMVSQLEGKKK
jgi:hypothetical protein